MYDGVELDVVRPAVAEGDREIDIRGRRSILAAVAATYKAPSGWETPKSRAVRPKFSCHDRDRRDSLASYARLPRCALYARCAMCRYVRCLTTHSTGIPRRERRRRAEAEARRHRRTRASSGEAVCQCWHSRQVSVESSGSTGAVCRYWHTGRRAAPWACDGVIRERIPPIAAWSTVSSSPRYVAGRKERRTSRQPLATR
jgi:hypothetical protein